MAAAIRVPACPRGHIVVPSVSLPGQRAGFQCALELDGVRWPLQAVPGRPAEAAANGQHAESPVLPETALPGGREVSTHIDCFHTECDLPESRLAVYLDCSEPPDRYLVTLSVRPLVVTPRVPASRRLVLDRPPAISQMRGPAPIRERICSPTALTMTLQSAQPDIDWQSVVDDCFDGRLFGSWPLAIHCAARYGRLAAVEVVDSWSPVLEVLEAGSPVVASIRFGKGQLPGAPLAETGGHLVSVYGIDGDRVLVCDPAAPDDASVPREYDLAAFTAAWMRRRGAAYLLAPP